MAYKDLPQFLNALEQDKQLTTISTQVSPDLEITEIADRVSKAYGKALLFTNVEGSKYPLVINTLGSYERLSMGLGVKHLDDIADQIEDFMNLSAYASLVGKLKAIPKLAPLPFIFPRTVKSAPCQEVVEDPDLDQLPIIKCWPQDGGKYITLPLVFTKDPETGQQNVGMYRLQVYDKKTTGMHWHLHKDGKEIYEKYRKLGKRMPVCVALGCDPATIYASTAPLPKMIDEILFAGYLKKRPVELVKALTCDIKVPAHAEFILEGYVDLEEERLEGPFGDHTGYYSLADMYPVFHLTKMTRKKNPIYPTTIVGKPPMEDCYLGKATERIFLPLMKVQCPEIVDIDFPLEGVFHNCAIISIKKAFPLHANKAMYALWGLGQMMYTKMLIIVDESVNVHDYQAVLEAMVIHANAKSHYVVTEGPLDALDHASNRAFQGYRLGIDATQKLPLEHSASLPLKAVDLSTSVHILPISQAKEDMPLHSYRYIILVDDDVPVDNYSTVSWKVFNNIDANRDISYKNRDDGTICLIIDATKKGEKDGLLRPWPDDIKMSETIQSLVTEKWNTYGIK